MRFQGFGSSVCDFFVELAENNEKTWFESHRGQWMADVRGPLESLLMELSDEFGGRAKLFRQHRDVRFAKDKSPYKLTTYGVLVDRGASAAGLYAEISSQGLYCGGGYHDMAKDQLARYRKAVFGEQGRELKRCLREAEKEGLSVGGESLLGPPRGVPKDHPRIVELKKKALVLGQTLAAGDPRLVDRRAIAFTSTVWTKCLPVCDWLDDQVGASEIPPEIRYGGGRPPKKKTTS